MKQKLLLVLSALLLAHGLASQHRAPGIRFDSREHDFGDINEEDGPASHDFVFTNTGSAPLQVLSVHASCGCTTPSWPREAIEPGGKARITVAYNPKRRPGVFSKSISVRNNATEKPVVLKIKGNVIPRPVKIEDIYPLKAGPVRASKTEIHFGTMPETTTRMQELLLVNTTKNRYEYKVTAPGHIRVMSNTFIEAGGHAKALVEYQSSAKGQYGPVEDTIHLEVNKNAYPIVVKADIRQDFRGLSPNEKKSAPVAIYTQEQFRMRGHSTDPLITDSLTIKNTGGGMLVLQRIYADDERFFAVHAKDSLSPSEETTVYLNYKPAGLKAGEYSIPVVFIVNVPKQPRKVMLLKLKVDG